MLIDLLLARFVLLRLFPMLKNLFTQPITDEEEMETSTLFLPHFVISMYKRGVCKPSIEPLRDTLLGQDIQ